jgi:putative NADH-flavin reductase
MIATQQGINKREFMNVTIFGGTGPTGLLTIETALGKGHHVTAYARNPKKILIQHDHLRIIHGELTEYEKMKTAITGADAVISLLGPITITREPVIANGTNLIIDLMKKNGTRRFITVVSSSYKDPKDKYQFMVELGIFLLKTLGNPILRDINGLGDAIRNSGLEWTMIRVPKMRSLPAVGILNIGYTGDGKFNFFKLTRVELANFLIHQLEDDTYLYQAPAVSNP